MVDSEEAQTAAQAASVRTAAYGTDENTATKQQAKLQSKTAGMPPACTATLYCMSPSATLHYCPALLKS